MTDSLAPALVDATIQSGVLVAADGTVLDTTGQGIGRQVNTAPEGAKFKVRVAGKKVTEILSNESGETHRREEKQKQDGKEAFAELLTSRRVEAVILSSTTEHTLPTGKGRRQHLVDVIGDDNFKVVGVTSTDFQLRIPVSGDKDWLVTGSYATTSAKVTLSINHYGRGSAW
ncbi:hypothetical protein AB0K00_35580 [Dactylosporangium sp. NPDC049525]|uniref:hypothetical protein n=1 Tax=Dactylosporangium sp. NPDC049525 TaxID=3154730 RepID=UPI00342BC96C